MTDTPKVPDFLFSILHVQIRRQKQCQLHLEKTEHEFNQQSEMMNGLDRIRKQLQTDPNSKYHQNKNIIRRIKQRDSNVLYLSKLKDTFESFSYETKHIKNVILKWSTIKQKERMSYSQELRKQALETDQCEYCFKALLDGNVVQREGLLSYCSEQCMNNDDCKNSKVLKMLHQIKNVHIEQYFDSTDKNYVPKETSIEAHRKEVDRILLTHQKKSVNKETVETIKELTDWANQSRANDEKFIQQQKERQESEKFQRYVLEDDLDRIGSFLKASQYQRDHFMEQVENIGNLRDAVNPPLQDYYTSRFKEDNPDFIFQFKLIQGILEIKEKLQVKANRADELAEELKRVKQETNDSIQKYKQKIKTQEETIQGLKNHNRSLKLNYDSINDKLRQFKIFSKKRTKTPSVTTSTGFQTDLSVTYGLLTNIHRYSESMGRYLNYIKECQVKNNKSFKQLMKETTKQITEVVWNLQKKNEHLTHSLQIARSTKQGQVTYKDTSVQVDLFIAQQNNHSSSRIPKKDAVMQFPEKVLEVVQFTNRSDSPKDSNENEIKGKINKLQGSLPSIEKITTRKRRQSMIQGPMTITSVQTPDSARNVNAKYANLKYSRFLSMVIRDQKQVVQRQTRDTWEFFWQMAKIQNMANLVRLDSDFIAFDMKKRNKIMIKLYHKAQNVLQVYKLRRKLYFNIRLQIEKAFKQYIIRINREMDEKNKEIKKKPSSMNYEQLTEHLRFILPNMYQNEWYSNVAGWKRSLQALQDEQISLQSKFLSKKERLKLDALAPLFKYNFDKLRVNMRKRILLDMIEYIKNPEKETTDKQPVLDRCIAYVEEMEQEAERQRKESLLEKTNDDTPQSIQAPIITAATASEMHEFVQKTIQHNAHQSFQLTNLAQDAKTSKLEEQLRLQAEEEVEFEFQKQMQSNMPVKPPVSRPKSSLSMMSAGTTDDDSVMDRPTLTPDLQV